MAQVRLILLATTNGHQGVSPGLASPSAHAPMIYSWMKAWKACTRLQQVVIVTSPDTHEQYVAWAQSTAGTKDAFSDSNLLLVDEPSHHPGQSVPLQTLASVLLQQPSLKGSYLIVASLDHFLGKEVLLQQAVEHTVVRGKDTVLFTLPPPGQSLASVSRVHFEPNSAAINPRVAGIELHPDCLADGLSDATVAAAIILHPSSLDAVQSMAQDVPDGVVGIKQFAFIGHRLLQAGKPVYGLQLDMCLECISEQGAAYAACFVEYHDAQVKQQLNHGPAAEALELVAERAQELGVGALGSREVETMLRLASPTKQILLRFDVLAEQLVSAKMMKQTKSGPIFGPRDLPERFADASTRRHQYRKQHPVYETTANEIGKRAPGQADMPDTYAGSTGAFTKTFAEPYKARGLITTVTRSKVHKLLDDF